VIEKLKKCSFVLKKGTCLSNNSDTKYKYSGRVEAILPQQKKFNINFRSQPENSVLYP
jgi:hypothetical protein